MNNGNCSQICTNTPGSFSCSCRSGYARDADNKTCNGTVHSKWGVGYNYILHSQTSTSVQTTMEIVGRHVQTSLEVITVHATLVML